MLRSRLYILAIVLIAVLWGAGVAVPTMDPAIAAVTVSTRLTDQEADCIVGGQAGCLEVAAKAYGGCVAENVDPEDPTTAIAYLDCAPVGAWTGVVCVATWFWGLFF